ncbi:OmpA family protein [Saccharibacter sp. 17.LH.SD]|uniref:OmpA family protein n=1 Tax=Saccharibacter sp. 17.LH.SD TaxID=2689393 RepID=UPI00136FBD1B|nr:OmpA family protein [Saccharibacter sp. 17.LH.SD]MXV43573.1 OmpA family protein [Saccharibacter sp. 17.LH.SD]
MSKLSMILRRYSPVLMGSIILSSALGGCAARHVPPPHTDYTILFDRDSTQINSVAEQMISTATQEAKNKNATQITVSSSAGYGNDPDVLKNLASRRADSVVEALKRDGVDSTKILKKTYPLDGKETSFLTFRRVLLQVWEQPSK